MRPIIPITLTMLTTILTVTILIPTAQSCFYRHPKTHIRIKLQKTTGATIGQQTFGTPQNGIAQIKLTKESNPAFMVTSSNLRRLQKAFYELKITIKLHNGDGELVGTAQLELIINGKRNPPKANNVVPLNKEIPKGNYQAVIKVTYWTAPTTHHIQDRFLIHVIPRAAQATS